MRVSSFTLVSSLSGLLLLGGLRYSAEKKTDKSEAAPSETVAKPMSDKDRRKQEAKLRKELEGPYRKWLNEDVAYIINDAQDSVIFVDADLLPLLEKVSDQLGPVRNLVVTNGKGVEHFPDVYGQQLFQAYGTVFNTGQTQDCTG